MKIFKSLAFSLILGSALAVPAATQAASTVIFNETPAKTIVIKHPLANDVNKFFASGTVFTFEVYKAGTKEEVIKILASLRSDPAVEDVIQGSVAGDYQNFTISLKTPKDKAWFISEFKKAGLGSIKINNNPVVGVDKL